ncbi:class II fumarate hydratase [Fictibacillus phosphorivorans]|uniref:class II fumarate hydratase n=1 Tax=Fictibacillus phosphorivorans TaxID=1221500 RepID=UPI002040181F|nr:class II fumarate hydratase [Fictibacillus phosphorivorans]MCM3776360.1 class II fumarate hydratase [Fictibacillus phosphorivorans]
MDEFRIAKDTLGEVKVPKEVYYGAQTQRAVNNFPISGLRLPFSFIKAQAIIKASAAAANKACGVLDTKKADSIIQAAEEIIDGKWKDQFVVDVYQAGAGTSQNMNVNEVIASRAAEILGGEKGDWSLVHPNDDVNMSQSTNDTIPTAINLSIADQLYATLYPAIDHLLEVLGQKEKEFHSVVKAGRTHLQDAVPIRLGSEFKGYKGAVLSVKKSLNDAKKHLFELGLGGNAVGTGINAHEKYAAVAIKEIAKRTNLPFTQSENTYMFMQNTNAAIRISSHLRELAIHLIKISSDLRLLSSGPKTGLAEITLPAVQPGSSIMPGKINPVILENLYMICSQVIGNDSCVTTAAIGSQLEINPMMPVIGYNVLQSITIISNGMNVFTDKCLKDIKANEERIKGWLEQSLSLVTALNPHIGYEKAAALAKESFETGKTLKDLLIEKEGFTPEEAERVLDPNLMI